MLTFQIPYAIRHEKKDSTTSNGEETSSSSESNLTRAQYEAVPIVWGTYRPRATTQAHLSCLVFCASNWQMERPSWLVRQGQALLHRKDKTIQHLLGSRPISSGTRVKDGSGSWWWVSLEFQRLVRQIDDSVAPSNSAVCAPAPSHCVCLGLAVKTDRF